MIGNIVCSAAGRDKGTYQVVIGCESGVVFVCDGKEHPLDRPKRKNPKHLLVTEAFLTAEQFSTNKSLRRALAAYCNAARSQKEEESCQKRI